MACLLLDHVHMGIWAKTSFLPHQLLLNPEFRDFRLLLSTGKGTPHTLVILLNGKWILQGGFGWAASFLFLSRLSLQLGYHCSELPALPACGVVRGTLGQLHQSHLPLTFGRISKHDPLTLNWLIQHYDLGPRRQGYTTKYFIFTTLSG